MLINNNCCGTLGYLIFHQLLSHVLIICKKLLEHLRKFWTLLERICSLRFFAWFLAFFAGKQDSLHSFYPVRYEITVISPFCGLFVLVFYRLVDYHRCSCHLSQYGRVQPLLPCLWCYSNHSLPNVSVIVSDMTYRLSQKKNVLHTVE